MPGFPTPTDIVGVNGSRRDRHKPGESPAPGEAQTDAIRENGAPRAPYLAFTVQPEYTLTSL